ncbi:MAG: CsbD family protein [Myxococcales bacterium]|nr:CsbD family protein [Myxococcales bacterium]
MNWNQIEGKWQQFTGHVKSTWGKLTDDDMTSIGGKKDQLIGKVKERYGIMQDAAEKQVDEWMAKLKPDHDADVIVPPPAASHTAGNNKPVA